MITSCVNRIELIDENDGVVGIIEAMQPLAVPKPGSIVIIPSTTEDWNSDTFLVGNMPPIYHYGTGETACTVEIAVEKQ